MVQELEHVPKRNLRNGRKAGEAEHFFCRTDHAAEFEELCPHAAEPRLVLKAFKPGRVVVVYEEHELMSPEAAEPIRYLQERRSAVAV